MAASDKIYNWGIVGCGLISKDFTKVLQRNPQSRVVACGARSLSRAKDFAEEFNISSASGSYEEVSKDPNVDIIYVGTIHPTHYNAVITACNNGKHVLCEKPIGMNVMQVREMVEAARKNNVFLMEAMWTRFFPAYRKARELIKNGIIGDIIQYYNDFSIGMPSAEELPRMWLNKLGGGALLDLGCYPLNPLSWVFEGQMPSKITVNGVLNKEHNIDDSLAVTLRYNRKQYAQINTNFYGNGFGERLICGTKGRIRMWSSNAPTKMTLYLNGTTPETARDVVEERTFEFKVPHNFETEFPGSEGLIYEVEEVIKCLNEQRTESPEYTWDEMIMTMEVMDEIRRQIGLTYDADNQMQSKL
eukprot:73705_1